MSRTIVVLVGVIGLTLVGGPSALTFPGGGSRDDGAGASGADARTRASAVALATIGSGRVTATEVGDEESFYEVEVDLADGRQIEVQLDENFAVVSSEENEDGADGNAD